jgi:Raf kinase inhibitor-like YbhB/YbcL family protein
MIVLLAVFALVSPQFAPGAQLKPAQVWNRDGCHGENRSPALRWTGAPARTKSLALGVFDPDAGAAGWWHWIVYDIPPARTALPTNVAPTSGDFQQGVNDFGVSGYGGPCPPSGPAHHYVFTLYALDVARLGAGRALHGSQFRGLLRDHVVATATLTGIYGR